MGKLRRLIFQSDFPEAEDVQPVDFSPRTQGSRICGKMEEVTVSIHNPIRENNGFIKA